MTARIDPNAFYNRDELHEILGKAAFSHVQAAGLFAVGDGYLGSVVLDCLRIAHQNKRQERRKETADVQQVKEVEKNRKNRKPQPASGQRRRHHVLGEMDEIAG